MAGHAGASTICQQLQQDLAYKFGFAANPTWIEQVIRQLQVEHAGFDQRPQSLQLQLVLEQLLLTDFRQAGTGGALPVVPKVSDPSCIEPGNSLIQPAPHHVTHVDTHAALAHCCCSCQHQQ